ncbi:40S ribosomal protein S21 [Sciurus carolinensis]|uniref:40S ribosomal protein S21 n=1 Tax=Sciurus carolinensis TaxID=30640 RepID=A0AA41MUN2_SCICA|nr:40S ribosomal protein S21 [Sciurus carolinensis]
MCNYRGNFMDPYVLQKCSASNHIIGAKDRVFIKMNLVKVDKVTGRFDGQFTTYVICGDICRMGDSSL